MKIVVLKENSLQFEATVLDDDLINGGELFIGREEDCHVILDSQMISRHHAIIRFEDNQLHIESKSSYGSIKVDGRDTHSAVIQNGSKVEINEFIIKFDQFSAITEAPDLTPSQEEPSINEPISVDEDLLNSDVEELDALEVNSEDSETVDNMSDEDYLNADPLDELSDLDGETSEGNDLLDETEPLDYAEEETLAEPDDITENDNLGDEDITDEASDFSNDDDFGDAGEENFGDAEDNAFGNDDEFGGGDDDGFGGGFEETEEKTQVLTSFASYSLKIFGEYAPFDTFKIDDAVTNIGRDTADCQIVLNDPEVSKIHAIIRKNIVSCTIEDNDSSNGIILNGERINKAELTNGDEFIIGETTFTVGISSDILDAEKGRLMPVEENQEIIIEDDTPADIDFNEGEEGLSFEDEAEEIVEEKSIIKKIMSDPKKRLYAIVGVIAFIFIFLVDESEQTPAEDPNKKENKGKIVKKKDKPQYSPEKLQELESNYNLAMAKFNEGQYYEAKEFIDTVLKIDPAYKLAASLDKSIQESLDLIARKKEEEQQKKERLEKLKRINELVEKAKKAVDEKRVEAARSYFSSVYELDPENIDIPPLKIEIDSYVAEKERIAQEEALKKAKRKAMVDKLAPGKAEYLKGEWYKAVSQLQRYIADKSIDEDLLKEATNMLRDSQKKLIEFVEPLRSKARSYKEAQDLKMAYETYGEVLKYDPSNEEALNEREGIFTSLLKRSRKVYREGLIKEDLSDFANAKEKYQEVQQISPINSEYYIKATEKLKNYLE